LERPDARPILLRDPKLDRLPEMTLVPNATDTHIGEMLRSARETLGCSVEEAAWKTRIRPEYLRALEEERFEACGHLAHARGHLHTYARFLGLDANAIVRDYATQVEHAEPSPIEQLNERDKEARKPPKPNWLIAALVAATLLVAASVAGIMRGPGPKTSPAGARSGLPVLPSAAQPTPQASAPAGVAADTVTLVVVSRGRSWISVVSDGATVFEGTLTEGVSKTFTGKKEMELRVGNAGMVRLILNGTDLGPPGRAGEVFHAFVGPRGIRPAK
jgi:cytoskeleton protein RodZ